MQVAGLEPFRRYAFQHERNQCDAALLRQLRVRFPVNGSVVGAVIRRLFYDTASVAINRKLFILAVKYPQTVAVGGRCRCWCSTAFLMDLDIVTQLQSLVTN